MCNNYQEKGSKTRGGGGHNVKLQPSGGLVTCKFLGKWERGENEKTDFKIEIPKIFH